MVTMKKKWMQNDDTSIERLEPWELAFELNRLEISRGGKNLMTTEEAKELMDENPEVGLRFGPQYQPETHFIYKLDEPEHEMPEMHAFVGVDPASKPIEEIKKKAFKGTLTAVLAAVKSVKARFPIIKIVTGFVEDSDDKESRLARKSEAGEPETVAKD